jgi:DNA primase
MPKVDFAKLKESVSIDRVFDLLGLKLRQHGDQWRGFCPICKKGDDRSFVVTVSKGCFYCFSHHKGGDMIALVAETRGLSPRDAAILIAQHTGTLPSTIPPSQNDTGSEQATGATVNKELKPLDYLDPKHERLAGIGVTAVTLTTFGAGFAPKGIMRGRLAIPIHDRLGGLIAYCGRALAEEETPTLAFPNGFNPQAAIFNAHRIDRGEAIFVTRDPLQVLEAYENGVANVVAFLGDINAEALRMLALLMDEKETPSVDLF